MRLRFPHFALTAITLFPAPTFAHSVPVTLPALSGSWDLRTSCMNNRGKPGACIEMKPRSLVFTFASEGKWSLAASDQSETRKAGSYEIQGNRLILRNLDGSLYQSWQTDITNYDQHLIVVDKHLIQTFERVKSGESPLE